MSCMHTCMGRSVREAVDQSYLLHGKRKSGNICCLNDSLACMHAWFSSARTYTSHALHSGSGLENLRRSSSSADTPSSIKPRRKPPSRRISQLIMTSPSDGDKKDIKTRQVIMMIIVCRLRTTLPFASNPCLPVSVGLTGGQDSSGRDI